jgi:uncharacterized membrane-anchored protein
MPTTTSRPLSKLPEITLAFWVMKICATTLGETAGDLLSMTLKVGYAASSLLLLGIFCITLGAQLRSKTYNPLLYWAVILSTSTAGTTLSDFMDRTLGLGYATGSAILASLLCAVLVYWKLSQKSLSIAHVRSGKQELLYWGAILVSNTLGTAQGDYLAGGALLIAGLIALIVAAYYLTGISRVALFWMAFVLTRPLGATAGDLLTKPVAAGGMNLGTAGASAVLLMILLITIGYTSWQARRVTMQSA